MSRRVRVTWVAGMLVTLALLAWVLHDVDWRAVVGYARGAHAGWLVLAVVTATATFPLRTLRWRLILRDADGRPFPLAPLWHATAVGFMANNLLPARAGEVARPYVAKRQLPVRFTTAFASVAVERALDGLTVVALMALALAAASFPGGASGADGAPLRRAAAWAAAGFGALLVAALLVVTHPTFWLSVLRRILGAVLPARWVEPVAHVAEGMVGGLMVLRHPGRLAAVAAWSLVLWLVNGLSFALAFRAFGLALPVEAPLLLQGVIAFGVAIPSSPGFVGVFEAATRVTLALYGVDASQAVSYALTYHLTTFIPITLFGLYSLRRVHVHLGDLAAARAAGEEPAR